MGTLAKEPEKITASAERLELAHRTFEEATGGTFELEKLAPRSQEITRQRIFELLVGEEAAMGKRATLGILRFALAGVVGAIPGRSFEVDEQIRTWFAEGPMEEDGEENLYISVVPPEVAFPEKTLEEVQAVVDDLVWKYDLPLSPFRLVEANLSPEQITHTMLAVAKERAKARLDGVVGYRGLTASVGNLPEGAEFAYPAYGCPVADPIVGGRLLFANNSEARVMVYRASGKRREEGWSLTTQVIWTRKSDPLTNPDEGSKMNPVEETKDQPHHKGEEVMSTMMETAGESIRVREIDARQLLVAEGYKMAYDPEKWTNKKIAKYMNSVVKLANPAVAEPSDPNQLALLRRCLKAIQDGKQVEVQFKEADGKAEANGQTKAEGKPKKKKKEKKEKEMKAGNEPVSRDDFGSRTGSEQAQINAALTKKPKMMKQIVEEASLVGKTFYDHLNRLVSQKKIKKTNEGFCLK